MNGVSMIGDRDLFPQMLDEVADGTSDPEERAVVCAASVLLKAWAGFPEQALRGIEEACALAREVDVPAVRAALLAVVAWAGAVAGRSWETAQAAA